MSHKRSKFGTGNDVLDAALAQEKTLTARWYLAMSGFSPWRGGEREENLRRTEGLERVIREEFAKMNVEWFANLPENTTS
jgi:hypothetical protein